MFSAERVASVSGIGGFAGRRLAAHFSVAHRPDSRRDGWQLRLRSSLSADFAYVTRVDDIHVLAGRGSNPCWKELS